MKIPVVRGVIERRILVNYRVDPEAMAHVLPSPFRPLTVRGYAIGGICLIRLTKIRPRFLPIPWGIRSENAAHRIAVEWDSAGETVQGVYIPRRDTDSRFNSWAGGRVFPGVHHHASFTVDEEANRFSVALASDDGQTQVRVRGRVASKFPATSIFTSLSEVSKFFETGALGYSPAHCEGCFDGLELCCRNWKVEPLDVEDVASSFFEDLLRFPDSTAEFDCALLMRGIEHEWHSRADITCPVNPH